MEINKPVTVLLTPQHLQTVLRALEDLPYKYAQPVMDELFKQIKTQFESEQTFIPKGEANGQGESDVRSGE
jgi:hypothetical protein